MTKALACTAAALAILAGPAAGPTHAAPAQAFCQGRYSQCMDKCGKDADEAHRQCRKDLCKGNLKDTRKPGGCHYSCAITGKPEICVCRAKKLGCKPRRDFRPHPGCDLSYMFDAGCADGCKESRRNCRNRRALSDATDRHVRESLGIGAAPKPGARPRGLSAEEERKVLGALGIKTPEAPSKPKLSPMKGKPGPSKPPAKKGKSRIVSREQFLKMMQKRAADKKKAAAMHGEGGEKICLAEYRDCLDDCGEVHKELCRKTKGPVTLEYPCLGSRQVPGKDACMKHKTACSKCCREKRYKECVDSLSGSRTGR